MMMATMMMKVITNVLMMMKMIYNDNGHLISGRLPRYVFCSLLYVKLGDDQPPDILVWFLLNGGKHIVEHLKKLLSGKAVKGDQVVRLQIFQAND